MGKTLRHGLPRGWTGSSTRGLSLSTIEVRETCTASV